MNMVKMNNHSEYPITNSEWVRNDSDDTIRYKSSYGQS